MFDNDFGMNLNFSITRHNDEYQIGVRYKDSTNTESFSQVITDNFEDAFNACISEVIENIIEQKNLNKQKKITEIQNRINDCEKEISELQQKISELKNKKLEEINTSFYL